MLNTITVQWPSYDIYRMLRELHISSAEGRREGPTIYLCSEITVAEKKLKENNMEDKRAEPHD